MNTLKFHLRQYSWRLRLRDAIDGGQQWLWIFALLALFIQGIGRIIPVPNLKLWTLAPVLGGLSIIAVYNLVKPFPYLKVARRIDSELGLRERLSTALFLQDLGSAFHPALVQAQFQDALSITKNIRKINLLPSKWSRLPLTIAALLIVTTMVLTLLPNPMDAILAQREAVSQVANSQAEQIEDLSREIADNPELSPEERQMIERELAELAEALRANSGDLEEALSDLYKAEQTLRQQLDPSQNARQANLDSISARLEALSGQQSDPNRSQLDNVAAAMEEISKQIGSMDREQRQLIADALAQMAAQSAQVGDGALSQALNTFSQAARTGDQEAALRASQSTQQALESSQSRSADQAAIEQALAQLQSSRQVLAQVGQAVAQSQSGQANTGQNPGQGPPQGQGPNSGQGNPGGGGGSKANTLPPATRQGRANRPQGSAPGAQASDLQGQVYAPWQRSPGSGDSLFIPGEDSGQGETQTREGQNPFPGSTNPSLVPYYEVYSNYLNAANQAMQQSYIPAGLLDYVRAYFTQLEP